MRKHHGLGFLNWTPYEARRSSVTRHAATRRRKAIRRLGLFPCCVAVFGGNRFLWCLALGEVGGCGAGPWRRVAEGEKREGLEMLCCAVLCCAFYGVEKRNVSGFAKRHSLCEREFAGEGCVSLTSIDSGASLFPREQIVKSMNVGIYSN